MAGRTFFSSSVGIGSASQVFAGEASTIFDTSSQLRGQNFARALGIRRFSGCVSDDRVSCSRRSDLMLVILVMKNSLNLSASLIIHRNKAQTDKTTSTCICQTKQEDSILF